MIMGLLGQTDITTSVIAAFAGIICTAITTIGLYLNTRHKTSGEPGAAAPGVKPDTMGIPRAEAPRAGRGATVWLIAASVSLTGALVSGSLALDSVSKVQRSLTEVGEQATLLGKKLEADLGSLRIMPVGSIIAWHPQLFKLPNDVEPPDGWVRCDGQTIVRQDGDARSGSTISLPDLNGALSRNPGTVWPDGYRMFLRGDGKSGNFEQDVLKDHGHKFFSQHTSVKSGTDGGKAYWSIEDDGDPYNSDENHDISKVVLGVESGAGTETHPVNMSVVWIMRVK